MRSTGAATTGTSTATPLWQRGSAAVGGVPREHQLRDVLEALDDLLADLSDACGRVLVTDGEGVVLWCRGAAGPERAAETSSVSAPIHDPDTGQPVGVVETSGWPHDQQPAALLLVTTTVRLAESHLRNTVLARAVLEDSRAGVVAPGPDGHLVRLRTCPPTRSERSSLTLAYLQDRPVTLLDGAEVPLPLRRAELVALLALHPGGLTGEQLAVELYGDHGNATTVRAEIHRLRAQLGRSTVRTRPYRLAMQVHADFLAVRTRLSSGSTAAALGACQAPLLPASEAPAVRAEREQLIATLRAAVVVQDDLDLLWTFSQREFGRDDVQVLDRLARQLPLDDPRRLLAEQSLARL